MLTRMTIKNFRSHTHTVLDFHPGVNAIIGRGQAGKSNIKRALEWVDTNRPLGTKFISWWANGEPAEVEIDVSTPEGVHTITMTKSVDSSAVYAIMGPGWREPTVFEAVGTKVPDAVKRILNLSTVNMQDQLAQPYLVTGSKGDISRAVNRVIQAEVADKWLGELNSRSARNNQHVKALEVTIETQQDAVDRMATLPIAEGHLIKAELVDNKVGVAQRRMAGIAKLVQDWVWTEQAVARWERVVGPLEELVGKAEAAQVAIDAATVKNELIVALWHAEQKTEALSTEYERMAANYVALLEELGQCPTCLSQIDERIITQLKEEL